MFERHGPGGSIGVSFQIEVALAPGAKMEKDPEFVKSIDPRFTVGDSRSNRIVQVADIAAYFVGKYLRALDERLILQRGIMLTKRDDAKLADQEFARAVWDALDLEVELFVHGSQVGTRPLWVRALTTAWEGRYGKLIHGKDPLLTEAMFVLRERLAVPPYNFTFQRFAR